MFLYIWRKGVFSCSQEPPNRCHYHGLKDLFSRHFLLAPTYLASNSLYKNVNQYNSSQRFCYWHVG
uniref:Uncharacterized protein n=1 Tax=Picea sitchensis TaxID=3332 RepID=D5AAV8_PICSI|nr:unknown [Picea sitchensis]